MNKRLIVCGGGERSGSTWQYNAVRALHGAGVYGAWIDDYEPGRAEAVHVIKAHTPTATANLPADVILTAYRDLRDVVGSMMRMEWLDLADVAAIDAFLDRYLTAQEAWRQRAAYIMKYEDMVAQPRAELARLAVALDISLTANALDAALDMVSAIKPAEATPAGATTRYDPETLLHAGHLSDGPRQLDDMLRTRIELRHEGWLRSNGYL
ncbi:MAG: sulfotransferase [Hyphomonadaceae bacterium JAD_PAG50586_4]|nr:MAG: sulfotransferase [Hyphomonadaceae bacterium JAD_PAG50586_4]